jgi:hypothetical protein
MFHTFSLYFCILLGENDLVNYLSSSFLVILSESRCLVPTGWYTNILSESFFKIPFWSDSLISIHLELKLILHLICQMNFKNYNTSLATQNWILKVSSDQKYRSIRSWIGISWKTISTQITYNTFKCPLIIFNVSLENFFVKIILKP